MKIKSAFYAFKLISSYLMSVFLCSLFTIAFAETIEVSFSKVSAKPILSFKESHGIMSGLDSFTTVKIYGNGLVKVHYPTFMKRAGDYEMILEEDALNELLQSFAQEKIPELNVNDILVDKKSKQLQSKSLGRPELYAVFDASITTFDMNFESYRNNASTQNNNSEQVGLLGSEYEVFNLEKKIEWKGIRTDAKRFPNIKAIQNLQAAQKMMLDIAENEQLTKVEK